VLENTSNVGDTKRIAVDQRLRGIRVQATAETESGEAPVGSDPGEYGNGVTTKAAGRFVRQVRLVQRVSFN